MYNGSNINKNRSNDSYQENKMKVHVFVKRRFASGYVLTPASELTGRETLSTCNAFTVGHQWVPCGRYTPVYFN